MAANEGWVKLNRSILDHWIWQDLEFYRAWTTLIMLANYEPKRRPFNGEIVTIEAGQLLGSVPYFAKATGLSPKRWRTLQKLLQKDGMIEVENTPKGARLSICNYSTYQDSGHTAGTLGARYGHAAGITIRREEVKNTLLRNVDMSLSEADSDSEQPTKPKRRVFVAPDYETCRQYAIQRKWRTGEAQRFYDYQQATGWKVGNKPMKDWQAAMRTWERNLPPSFEKVQEYFQSILSGRQTQDEANITAKQFYTHYDGRGWTTGTGQRITNFEALAMKWIQNNGGNQ